MSEIASFRQKLRNLDFLLDDPAVSEIAINGPGNVWAAYRGSRFMRPVAVEGVTLKQIKTLAELIASHTQQDINAYTPILSGRIPMDLSDGVADSERGDYRVQCVLAPAVEQHVGGIVCIRKPGRLRMTMDKYIESGAFDHINDPRPSNQYSDEHLVELYRAKRWPEFFEGIVKAHKNIMISAGTNTGKTTFLNFLFDYVDPNERIVTIEDSREIQLQMNNVVHLLYSRGGQGKSRVTPFDHLESILRLTPDRAIMGELRGAEAYPYLELLNTGHSGSFSTIHSDSPDLMFDRLASMASRGGSDMTKNQLVEFSRQLIDVVIQWQYGFDGKRYISEVQYAKAA